MKERLNFGTFFLIFLLGGMGYWCFKIFYDWAQAVGLIPIL